MVETHSTSTFICILTSQISHPTFYIPSAIVAICDLFSKLFGPERSTKLTAPLSACCRKDDKRGTVVALRYPGEMWSSICQQLSYVVGISAEPASDQPSTINYTPSDALAVSEVCADLQKATPRRTTAADLALSR